MCNLQRLKGRKKGVRQLRERFIYNEILCPVIQGSGEVVYHSKLLPFYMHCSHQEFVVLSTDKNIID